MDKRNQSVIDKAKAQAWVFGAVTEVKRERRLCRMDYPEILPLRPPSNAAGVTEQRSMTSRSPILGLVDGEFSIRHSMKHPRPCLIASVCEPDLVVRPS